MTVCTYPIHHGRAHIDTKDETTCPKIGHPLVIAAAVSAGSSKAGDGGSGGSVVAALHMESMSSAVHGETRIFVMVVTANPLRLYLFMGGPTLEVTRFIPPHFFNPSTSWALVCSLKGLIAPSLLRL